MQGCTWDSLTNRFLPHTPYTCLILYNHVMCFWTMNMALFLLFMYRELLPMFTLTWKSRVLVSILDFMIAILNYLTAISLSLSLKHTNNFMWKPPLQPFNSLYLCRGLFSKAIKELQYTLDNPNMLQYPKVSHKDTCQLPDIYALIPCLSSNMKGLYTWQSQHAPIPKSVT